MPELTLPLYAEDIRRILPHRYPFLLVDRVTEIEIGKRAVGYKLVSSNEPQFQGHYPDYSIMPGVLMIEAMAQIGGLAALTMDELVGKTPLFAGIDNARFRGQVRPGDKLDMVMELDRFRGTMGKAHGTASVDGKLVCEAAVIFALVSVEK